MIFDWTFYQGSANRSIYWTAADRPSLSTLRKRWISGSLIPAFDSTNDIALHSILCVTEKVLDYATVKLLERFVINKQKTKFIK